MKITEIAIFDHKQFKNFVVDLTYPKGHPKAGKSLDKVCFIGPNGTGKTTILEILKYGLDKESEFRKYEDKSLIGLSFQIKLTKHLQLGITVVDRKVNILRKHTSLLWINEEIGEQIINNYYKDRVNTKNDYLENSKFQRPSFEVSDQHIIDFEILFRKNLTISSPSESFVNNALKIKDDFDVSLYEAFEHFNDSTLFFSEVSNEKIKDFWKILTYQVKKREDDYQKFLKQEHNRSKTVAEVEANFDKENPKILDKIAKLWNQILEKAGLEFDAEGASNPIQLTDNLKAYIRLKSNKQPIPYNELSTGIRNFIFKVGHIYSLYFNRNIESGFLMIDEPENSLFPDFLYDIVGIYQEITQNTQIFMATHSPIIAAQFEPCERIILDFDDEGYVTARKGIVPTGDDPNDILVKDFGIRSLLGKEGVEKWERFIELKLLIKSETNIAQKAEYINEYMEIGKAYNFGYDIKLKQDEANYQKS